MYTKLALLIEGIIWPTDKGEAKEERRYIPQQSDTASPAFLFDWSSLQISSAKAGMITKQDIAWKPNKPTSTITEPIISP